MLRIVIGMDMHACDSIFANMGTTFKFYKRRFRNALEPVFVMLINKKSRMDNDHWNLLLEKVTIGILNKPDEFLGTDLPSHEMTCDVLYEIFEQFIREKGNGKSSFQSVASHLIASRNFSVNGRLPDTESKLDNSK